MKYIVYLTTSSKSKINGINRIYVGVHKTNKPEIFDGYLGCGVYLNQPSSFMYPKNPFQCAVKKYGANSFNRETLFIYDNKEDAYNKEKEIVDEYFISQPHTFNSSVGGIKDEYCKTLYQFDLSGNLKKKWNDFVDACTFYGISYDKFKNAIDDKCVLLNSFWSFDDKINTNEYSDKQQTAIHLYNEDGKWVREFSSINKCSEFTGLNEKDIYKVILQQRLILGKYYISNKVCDMFKPKPRRQFSKSTFYVYNEDGSLIGTYKGKKVMPVIGTHSWRIISDTINKRNGWYKNFCISDVPIDKIPDKPGKKEVCIDIYDKYGTFIETVNSIKELKEKYNITASKIKNIQLGNKYYNDYIFKYNSK